MISEQEQRSLLDALGNEIIIGSFYGYSTSTGGRHRTVVATAEKILSGHKVSLRVVKSSVFLYGDPITDSHTSPTVRVSSYILFPVRG